MGTNELIHGEFRFTVGGASSKRPSPAEAEPGTTPTWVVAGLVALVLAATLAAYRVATRPRR